MGFLHVGRRNHKLFFEMRDYLKRPIHQKTTECLRFTMLKYKSSLKNRAVLNQHTNLASVSPFATRWSGTYKCYIAFN